MSSEFIGQEPRAFLPACCSFYAVAKLLSYPDLAARFSQAGRQHALENFTFDVFEEKYRVLFDIVLSGRSLDDPLARASAKEFHGAAVFGRPAAI